MQTGSNELIRDINSRLVLETILQNGSISRADISKKLGLTRATISAITEDLNQQNLICEAGSAASSQGRKAILFQIRQEQAFHICINLTQNIIVIMCADLLGSHQEFFEYPAAASRDKILPALISYIENALKSFQGPGRLARICIAVHGTVYRNEITFCPYSPYENLPFSDVLSNRFHVPVLLENEANLCALGEHTFCSHKSSMIMVSIHSGIGVGIMIQDQLFLGYNGKAGEFGHSIVQRNGRPCPCGNRGCLEQYASEQAVVQDYCDLAGLASCSVENFISACLDGSPKALEILYQFEEFMVICINNLLNLFNPEVIVLNCRITSQIPDCIKRISLGLKTRMKEHCTLLPSMLQDKAVLLGGICLCTKDYLGIQRLDLTGHYTKKEGPGI